MPLKGFASERPALLWGAALLSCLFVYYYTIVYYDYVPSGEDAAFIGALDFPVEWFTQGYAGYFHVYPEWATPRDTELLKPVTNLVAFISDALFGENYALHFLLYFLIQFAALIIILRICRESSVPPLPAACIGILFLANPAFVNAGLWCLACHFDVLAALWALSAFYALWHRRNALAFLFLILAVFTKETAAFAPIAAALSVVIWGRERRSAIMMLLPLVIWAGARTLAYGGVLDERVDGEAASIAVGLLFWPTGVTEAAFIEQLFSAFAMDRHSIISLVFVIANIGLWVFIVYAASVIVGQQLDHTAHAKENSKLVAGLLIWALGALSIGVIVAHEARYGASTYAFLYLLLAAISFVPGSRVPRWISASVLLVFAAGTLWHAQANLRLIVRWPDIASANRSLHGALEELPQDGRLVYVVNAPPSFIPAMKYLNRGWSLNLEVVVISQFQGCETATDGGATQLAASGDVLDVRIPDCAQFNFYNVGRELLQRGITEPLARAGVGTYRFPDGVALASADLAGLGHALTLEIEPGRSPTVVAYEWNDAAYRVVSRP